MTFPHQQTALCMIPHARTLRKAREQVKSMVTPMGHLPDISENILLDGSSGGTKQ